MPEKSEGNMAAEGAENIESFRRQLAQLQKDRSEIDGTITQINIESLGGPEMAIWTRYKDLLDKITQKDFMYNDENITSALEEENGLEDGVRVMKTTNSGDVGFIGWMKNRFVTIKANLQMAMMREPEDTDEYIRKMREELYDELVVEKERIFGAI